MKKFIFLDRDGVLVRFPGKGKYVTRDSQMKPIAHSAKAVAILTKAGYEMVVISNQGCVSRGMITRVKLAVFTKKMLRWIRKAGGKIRKVYYCVHQSSDDCQCKKPKSLLLEKAVKGRRVKPREAIFVGDSAEDIEAGSRFGCRTVLVLSGRNKLKDVHSLPVKPEYVKKNLLEVAQWLTKKS